MFDDICISCYVLIEMAVVLDNGGFSVKIGYSTDEEPRCLRCIRT